MPRQELPFRFSFRNDGEWIIFFYQGDGFPKPIDIGRINKVFLDENGGREGPIMMAIADQAVKDMNKFMKSIGIDDARFELRRPK